MSLVLATTTARAEPAAVGFYGEPSVWGGKLWGEYHGATGFGMDVSSGMVDLRLSLGAAIAIRPGWNARVGAAVDVFKGQSEAAALGIEAQALRDLRRAWRIGLRVSASLGNGNGVPTSGDGQIVMAGLRIHRGVVVFGVDGVFIRNGTEGNHGFANGILAGVGIGGRPGKYGIAISAGGAALLGILAVVALRQAYTH